MKSTLMVSKARLDGVAGEVLRLCGARSALVGDTVTR